MLAYRKKYYLYIDLNLFTVMYSSAFQYNRCFTFFEIPVLLPSSPTSLRVVLFGGFNKKTLVCRFFTVEFDWFPKMAEREMRYYNVNGISKVIILLHYFRAI